LVVANPGENVGKTEKKAENRGNEKRMNMRSGGDKIVPRVTG
jgi:hypothetical protein